MCGIVASIGKRNVTPILLDGLKTLAYRGYDSAGIAVCTEDTSRLIKSKGGIDELEKKIAAHPPEGFVGIGHTRWATHGLPNETNAHPHHDAHKRVFVVHNGIIENHNELRHFLKTKGYTCISETDTEVIPHLIAYHLEQDNNFEKVLYKSLAMLKGAYALAIIDTNNPETLYGARLSSPLVIGIGKDEFMVASDTTAVVGSVTEAVHLLDGDVVTLTKNTFRITDLHGVEQHRPKTTVDISTERAQKGSFDHFMLKEIHESPETVRAALRGRIQNNEVRFEEGESLQQHLPSLQRISIVACGTSYYAGLIGEYLLESIASIPTDVHLASEYRYKDQPTENGTAILCISQSGETADTLAALSLAKAKGMMSIGLVNVVGSTLSRETDVTIYNRAGPEISVASTKAFISQVTTLALLAISLSKKDTATKEVLIAELQTIPQKIETILVQQKTLERIAKKYQHHKDFFYIGRKYNFPTALEGALKLKEVSYIHAEGYPAGELKHGPIAMVDSSFPTVALVPTNSVTDKMYSNIEEIRARSGPMIAIATEGDTTISSLADDVFFIPPTLEPLEPLLAVIPLHLFSYFMGVERGINVDMPRNLAKAVTVE